MYKTQPLVDQRPQDKFKYTKLYRRGENRPKSIGTEDNFMNRISVSQVLRFTINK